MPKKSPKAAKKTTKKTAPKKTQNRHEDVFAPDTDFIHEVTQDTEDTNMAEVVFEDSFGQQEDLFADDLSEIYGEDDDDKKIDMNTFDQKRKRGKLIAAGIGVLILLIGVSYLGFKVFSGVVSSEEAGKVDFTMTASQEVASGEVITLDLTFTNNRTVDISGEMELFYPGGFIFQQASQEATDEENTLFGIEELGPGKTQTISITGQLIGSTDVEKDFSALLTYQPSNFSSDFQETATTTVKITSSLIDVTIEGPEQVQSGEEFTLSATFENTSDAEMLGVQAEMIYPEGFSVSSAQPEATDSNDEWYFETVSPQSSETIEITGKMASAESGAAQAFQFQVGVKESDDTFTLQGEASTEITVVNPEIELSLDVTQVTPAGSTIPVSVTVNNTSEATLQNVEILLTLDTDFFDDDATTLSIDELPAGESTTITADVTVKDNPSDDIREGSITATIPSAYVEGSSLQFPNEAGVTVQLQSSFEVIVSGGSPDSSSDVLTVGETSLYTVYWSIQNGGENIDSFTMSTTLPKNVEWAGDASSGLTYDSGTGAVTYEKDSLPGSFEKDLSFTVSVTPTSSDVGSTLQLTNETVAFGIDAFTEQDISFSQPAVQTNSSVKKASSQGSSPRNDLED